MANSFCEICWQPRVIFFTIRFASNSAMQSLSHYSRPQEYRSADKSTECCSDTLVVQLRVSVRWPRFLQGEIWRWVVNKINKIHIYIYFSYFNASYSLRAATLIPQWASQGLQVMLWSRKQSEGLLWITACMMDYSFTAASSVAPFIPRLFFLMQ